MLPTSFCFLFNFNFFCFACFIYTREKDLGSKVGSLRIMHAVGMISICLVCVRVCVRVID